MPGISEMCAGSAHQSCTDATCRCGCHPHVQAMMRESAAPKVTPITTGNKRCPKCGGNFKASDIYCRKDGELLASSKCNLCGAPTMAEDSFCWKCGKGLVVSSPPEPELPADVVAAMEAKARQRPSDVESPVVTELP